jgi:hypothetical protein
MAVVEYPKLASIAAIEFRDIVQSVAIVDAKLRVLLIDHSYIDFWWSTIIPDRFAHHWERRPVDGKIYRHDNSPHLKWQHIETFPQHFHSGSDQNVLESTLSKIPEEALREFLKFARAVLTPP